MKDRKGTGLPGLELQIILSHDLGIGHQGWVSTRAVSTLNPGYLLPHKECFISNLLVGWTSFPLLHLSLQMFPIMSHRKGIDITYISIDWSLPNIPSLTFIRTSFEPSSSLRVQTFMYLYYIKRGKKVTFKDDGPVSLTLIKYIMMCLGEIIILNLNLCIC